MLPVGLPKERGKRRGFAMRGPSNRRSLWCCVPSVAVSRCHLGSPCARFELPSSLALPLGARIVRKPVQSLRPVERTDSP
jgi:hypothetical protein